ncbi:MAG: radical SAM protein [Candidatus Omnitrophica bacterium]|nr:radical SAM protein [Candidatus Omnitrophota bacterium]
MDADMVVATKIKRFKRPPALAGYTYPPKLAQEAASRGGLLAMRIETNNACNFNCIYCNSAVENRRYSEMPLSTLKDAIAEGASLGCKSVVVIGGGEPTLYRHFKALVCYINQKGMIPVVITNASSLDLAMAQFLFDENASILFKLDSFKEKIQNRLSGNRESYKLIMRGIKNLFSVGFNKDVDGVLRCGASFVLTKFNYNEIVSLWKFCRDNNLFPNLEQLILRGNALAYASELIVDRDGIRKLKERLSAIDRYRYGYDWLVYSPLPGYGCLQHLYSIYVDSKGYIRPCADIDIKLFNIRKMKIREILKTPFFLFVRNIGKHLQGRCAHCRHHALCVGCRGNAFNVGLQEGLDVYKALVREDPLCWKE